MLMKRPRVCPTRAIEEPKLGDLLQDPTTHLVMESDGVREKELTDLLARARERLSLRPSGQSGA